MSEYTLNAQGRGYETECEVAPMSVIDTDLRTLMGAAQENVRLVADVKNMLAKVLANVPTAQAKDGQGVNTSCELSEALQSIRRTVTESNNLLSEIKSRLVL